MLRNGCLKLSGSRIPSIYAVPTAIAEYPAKSKNKYKPYVYALPITIGMLNACSNKCVFQPYTIFEHTIL